MTAEPDLLPCPFCGGQVFVHHGRRDIGYVTCGQRDDGSDGCGVVASFRPNKGGREAIAAWNRRANVAHALTEKQAEVEFYKLDAGALHVQMGTLIDSIAAKDAEVEALRAEVGMLRDAFSDDDMTAGAHWFGRYVEQKRHAERLAEALREMREYVTAALQDQREAFAGHEDSSDIPGIEADLHKIDALLREQENDDA